MALHREPVREDHGSPRGLDRRQAVRGCHQDRPVRRRALTACAAATAAALLAPAAASAHGLAQREALPIPQWLFAWAAAAVLVISFFALAVLWPQAKLERDDWRPVRFGRALASTPAQILFALFGLLLFFVTIGAGYLGSGTALDNWAPTF